MVQSSKSSLFFLLSVSLADVEGFTLAHHNKRNPTITTSSQPKIYTTTKTTLFNTDGPTEEEIEAAISKTKLSPEEISQVGNLVADDEWMGLGMELSELVRTAVVEEVKKNTSDFIGKDEYKVGDITKEIDARVKVRLKVFFLVLVWLVSN